MMIRDVSYVIMYIMARQMRSGDKPEQVSLRIPKELAVKIDYFKEKEGTDRSVIILRALRYWIEIDGNVTTDNEFLNRLEQIENNIGELKKIIERLERDKQKDQETILKQQNTIETLLELVKK